MSRFVLGDELGNVKLLRPTKASSPEAKCTIMTVYHQDDPTAPVKSVQKLAVSCSIAPASTTLAVALSDGSCSLSSLKDDDTLSSLATWKETRITGSRFIGLSLTDSAAFTCSSNGMLRRTSFTSETDGDHAQISGSHCATLPSRLNDWRLAENGETFAYGGEEVDLSIWNTELAFQEGPSEKSTAQTSKKRKRNDDLFPAEVWRARNLPNDNLGLRQPIRITALTYLESSANAHHIMTGTQFGDLRRYDTRAARRPVSNWTGLGKVGGVKVVEKGFSDHELFMGDGGSNLYSIDLRTGGILYGYKGISGAVTSIAPSPTTMVSTALDRFARVHSLVAPPNNAGAHQERKGEVLEKTYLTSAPTVVIWDKQESAPPQLTKQVTNYDEGEDDDVWNNLENVS